MRIVRFIAAGAALLVVGGCADGAASGPTAPAAAALRQTSVAAPAARPTEVSGEFDALVDFTTLSLTPRGSNCLLVVEGELVFTGDIAGSATGVTSALVFAPCELVATTPPGTFRDVFRSELEFEGTVAGEATRSRVLYMGGVEPGGGIDGRLVFFRGAEGVLDASAVVAVGGTYDGSLVVR